jgi:hypothetical protein
MQSTKNFTLKTGSLISFKGVTYSEKYLPEAACIEMLLARPELRKKFKTVNEDLLKETPVIQTEVIEKVIEKPIVTEVKVPVKKGRKPKK